MNLAKRRGLWVAGGIVVPSAFFAACIYWGDEASFLRGMRKDSLGGGYLPFDQGTFSGKAMFGPPTPSDRVFNVYADFGHVLQAARDAGYRITHHDQYALGERGAGEPHLFFAAGRAYVPKGSDYESGSAKSRTVVGVEYHPSTVRLIARRFGLASLPADKTFRIVFDPNYLPRWGTP